MSKTYQPRGGCRMPTKYPEVTHIGSVDDILEYCIKEQIKMARASAICEQCNLPRASALAKGRADAIADLLELLAPFVESLPKRDYPNRGVTETVTK